MGIKIVGSRFNSLFIGVCRGLGVAGLFKGVAKPVPADCVVGPCLDRLFKGVNGRGKVVLVKIRPADVMICGLRRPVKYVLERITRRAMICRTPARSCKRRIG